MNDPWFSPRRTTTRCKLFPQMEGWFSQPDLNRYPCDRPPRLPPFTTVPFFCNPDLVSKNESPRHDFSSRAYALHDDTFPHSSSIKGSDRVSSPSHPSVANILRQPAVPTVTVTTARVSHGIEVDPSESPRSGPLDDHRRRQAGRSGRGEPEIGSRHGLHPMLDYFPIHYGPLYL